MAAILILNFQIRQKDSDYVDKLTFNIYFGVTIFVGTIIVLVVVYTVLWTNCFKTSTDPDVDTSC